MFLKFRVYVIEGIGNIQKWLVSEIQKRGTVSGLVLHLVRLNW